MRSTRAVQVVDASVVIDAFVPVGRRGLIAASRLSVDHCVAPELLDIEVVNALRGMVRRDVVPEAEALLLVHSLGTLGITRRPHRPLLPRIWELRDNLTAYDATYVALAEALRCPLVTSDARIASAPGIRCEVEVIGT